MHEEVVFLKSSAVLIPSLLLPFSILKVKKTHTHTHTRLVARYLIRFEFNSAFVVSKQVEKEENDIRHSHSDPFANW